jgi:ketosteroid isomerase-like protein
MNEKKEVFGAQIAARLACLNLIAAHAKLIDEGEASQTVAQFTDDCEVVVGPNIIKGINAFRGAMTAREANRERKTLHVWTNIHFSDVSEEVVVASSIIQLYILNPEPVPLAPSSLLKCDDRFERGGDGQWRFARRALNLIVGKA